jgi:hypothetical protein
VRRSDDVNAISRRYAGGHERSPNLEDDADKPVSPLRALPVARWAARFHSGQVALRGVLQEELLLGDANAPTARIRPGVVWTRLFFEGDGKAMRVTRLLVSGAVQDIARDRQAAELEVTADGAQIDGFELAGTGGCDALVSRLIDSLWDLQVRSEAVAGKELLIRFGAGLAVRVPPGERLVLRGATLGPAHRPRLVRPLVVATADHRVRLTYRRLRWLAAAGGISVSEAALHPDGSVRLAGGRGRLDRIIVGGLSRVATQLSHMVKDHPRYARVRAFLD